MSKSVGHFLLARHRTTAYNGMALTIATVWAILRQQSVNSTAMPVAALIATGSSFSTKGSVPFQIGGRL